MASDVVVLYNLALDTIGARAKISLPTEQSREAEACNLWYPNIRDQVLASAAWPEATKMARLSLLVTQDTDEDGIWASGDPRPDLLNSYALPSDMLRPQYVAGYGSFSIQSYGTEQRALMTSGENPVLVYTFRQTKVSMWSPELQMAIMYGLAASICISLTGKTSRAKSLMDLANAKIIAARESAANMGAERFESLPDWITARGFSGGSPPTRYIYPFASLLSSNVG